MTSDTYVGTSTGGTMGLFRKSDHHDGTTLTPEPPAPSTAQPSRATITAGVPGRCPACDGFGYIDHIDMVNRIQTQHCRNCAHRWEYSFDEAGEVVEVIDLTDSAQARSLTS
jgi:hypothetical protein